MKLEEAYKILNLSRNSTPEEAKKRYKELCKTEHPDLKGNSSEATEKFKQINEAFECVKSGKGTDPEDRQQMWQSGGSPFDIFSSFFGNERGNPHHQSRMVESINLYTTITFAESILGCKKQMSFSRESKCEECNGQGKLRTDNGCAKCKGRGVVTSQQGGMIFQRTCDKCRGQVNTVTCNSCGGIGSRNSQVSVDVNIPGGIENGNILRLGGMGNYAGNTMFGEQSSDAFLNITVIQEPGLKLDGQNVISKLELSLLEALKGCEKTVKTISGNKDIEVKPLSRNADTIILPNLGVNGKGSQVVTLDVRYPEDVGKLIDLLI
jgi:molecular chaperone DnaJ